VSYAGPGYWCEVCQCLQKDSVSYLDHINGKKHQRALGFSMRVERVGVDKVKERLEALKRKVGEASRRASEAPTPAIVEYDAKMAERSKIEDSDRKRRKDEKEIRKKTKLLSDDDPDENGVDGDIAGLMGFGGFGTSKAK
jgi:U4/U6.U5 tri-snRNP component SNU23